MKKKDIIICICFLLLAGCTASKHAAQPASQGLLVPNGPAWAALWQQRSAEYKALCFQAYNIAKERLDSYLLQPGIKNPAVITDIDETVLDNSPYEAHEALNNALYSDSSWMVWTAKVACDTVPGALSFLKYAASRGIQVFYITNRLEAEKKVTVANLKKWSFPNADDEHVLLKANKSNKDDRRNFVANNHTVLLLLGDNLGDFESIFDHQSYEKRNELAEENSIKFGSRFIVLPNPMYGEWQGALINYQYSKSKEQQNAEMLKWLKTY